MNLKLNGIILLIGVLIGGFCVYKFMPKEHKSVAPVAIPESEELSKLKKQLAEYSSKKKSVVKEFNCANGALSKETSVDEAIAAKIAKESEEKLKKTEELVVKQSSKYALGLFREYDFKNQKDVYELSIYRHAAFGFHVGFSANTVNQLGIGILKTF